MLTTRTQLDLYITEHMEEQEKNQVAQVERDRVLREKEALILFLILFGTATRHATMAIRLGHDPGIAVQNVIRGNPQLGLPGLSPSLAKLMALTHADGYRRADLLAGIRPTLSRDEVMPDVIAKYYPASRRMSSAMANTLTDKINEAIGEAPADANARRVAAFVRNAIASDGYGKDHPYLLETVAERMVVDAHGAGMWSGWQRPELNERLKGFVHKSVMTKTTTTICKERNGLALPKDDPYWLTGFPQLHWGCRSVVLACYTDREWSTVYPTTPPDPGFGYAPWAFMTYGQVA